MISVYLSGHMDASKDWTLEWRKEATSILEDAGLHIISPCDGKEHFWQMGKFDQEDRATVPGFIITRDYQDVMRADLILVYLTRPFTPGTCIELGWAWEQRKPVIAIGYTEHPFLQQCISLSFTNLKEACDGVIEYYAGRWDKVRRRKDPVGPITLGGDEGTGQTPYGWGV